MTSRVNGSSNAYSEARVSALRGQLPEPGFALLELSAQFFLGLGDPIRLKILEILLKGEKSVSDLVHFLGIQQGRWSNHLACLKWPPVGVSLPRRLMVAS